MMNSVEYVITVKNASVTASLRRFERVPTIFIAAHNFYSRNKEIMNSPATLTFSCIKWVLPGYSLHRLVFLMYNSDHLWLFTITIINYQN